MKQNLEQQIAEAVSSYEHSNNGPDGEFPDEALEGYGNDAYVPVDHYEKFPMNYQVKEQNKWHGMEKFRKRSSRKKSANSTRES
jgi:hypothetical protein